MNTRNTSRAEHAAFAAVAIAAAAAPAIIQSEYVLGILILIGTLAISATGMVLMFGLAHQLVLGQAAFCLVGAYGTGLLTVRAQWDPLLALVASACISMAFAYLIGRPILQLRGFVLALASLAVQLILIHFAAESMSLTGGSMGLNGVPTFGILGWQAGSVGTMLIITWFTVLLCVLVCRNIAGSRIGRSLRAIGSSEAGAASVGVDITRQKVRMFVLSAAMASVAGSLTAHYLRIVEPQIFNLQYGFTILTAVIIGGLISPWGGVLGAVLLTLLREALKGLALPLVELLIIGIVTVLALIFMPGGLTGVLRGFFRQSVPGEMPPPSAATAPAEPAALPPPATAFAPPEAASTPLLQARGVSIAFGSLKAVDGVSFDVPRGSITALIGPNGAGKTTTFNLLCGYYPLSAGKVVFDGVEIQDLRVDEIARLGVARTFQLIQLFSGLTVLDNVMAGRQRFARSSIVDVALGLPSHRRDERDARDRAMQYLRFVGLEHVAHMPATSLPFGQQRQVELARALAMEPKLLIMDEPASGLNDSETEALAELIIRIRASGTAILLVEHDIRLVMGLADHVVVLDRGRKLAEGLPDDVRNDQAVLDAYLVGSPA